MRPLENLPTIRAKLGSVIVFAVGMTLLLVYLFLGFALQVFAIRDHLGELLAAGAIAAGVALLMTRWLARGMTKPLRDMAQAARRMERGDYGQRVVTGSVDEVGQLAQAFNRMSAELDQLERLRRDLVANVSHELKTPISALRAHLENLLDGVEQPDPQTLQVMLAQSERLGRLVDQLLELSRLESGDVPLQREEVALAPLVSEVLSEIEVALADRRVEVRGEVPVDLPSVFADRERLHQVLFNLLDNAVRYTPSGGRIALAWRAQDEGAVFEVRDSGIGIAQEHLPRLTERFYRVDRSRSRETGGTGLGLAIVKHVLVRHQGRLLVDSAPGQGSTFRAWLPEARLQSAPAALKQAA